MPGTVVTVTLPSSVMSTGTPTIHIGGWSDWLYKKTTWKRLPEMLRKFTVKSETTIIASAYGGLIYVTLPKNLNLGVISVTVTGRCSFVKLFFDKYAVA